MLQTAHFMTADMNCCDPHNGKQPVLAVAICTRGTSDVMVLLAGFWTVTGQCARRLGSSNVSDSRVTALLFVKNLHCWFNPQKPSGHYMYHQFNIHKYYILPTQCIYVLCGSENKQRLFPYTALTDWFL
jgi:hypothetical protein